jgi:mono/diheme cytochrome c family protein/sugar lactone lactonase YvrE
MRTPLPLALLIIAALIGWMSATAQSSSSVWDGVYTEAQAALGTQEYGQYCAMCHGSGLNGNGEAPALQGGEFLDDFDGLTVGDLFDRLRKSMPSNAPGSLNPQVYADILAYMLKANGFPAGHTPLSDRSSFLHAIMFEVQNPHSAAPSASAGPRGPHSFGAAPVFTLVAATAYRSEQSSASQGVERPSQPAARVQPADLAALAAANESSGVLSPAASDPRNAPNSQPDPYRAVAGFFKLPPGRTLGSTSGVAVDSRGDIWVADRCGANSCQGSTLDPIMEFDAQGNFIKAFGAGMFNFPHGFYIDRYDHIWVTDQRASDGKGADVLEFDENGKVLRTLGKPGVQREGPDTFSEPTAVIVAPNHDIFVADGHEAGPDHSARVVKFDHRGRFLMQWGGLGIAAGRLDVPHCLAMDNEGRVYVGDRWNNRIQVFTQNGKLLRILTQFGRPSGIYIDKHDVLYVTDSESRAPYGYGYHPGWQRGIRVGGIKDGIVTAFIPDDTRDQDKYATSGGEGIWADASGAIYSAQVKQMAVAMYVKQ